MIQAFGKLPLAIGFTIFCIVFDRWGVLSKLDSSKEYFLNHIDYNLDKLMVNTTYDSINNFIEVIGTPIYLEKF